MISNKRILLKPLSYEQLVSYILEDGDLENELKLNFKPKGISAEAKNALQKDILPNVTKSGKNYRFNTLWIIISQSEKLIVGEIVFLGSPDLEGEVELGYLIYEGFRNKGYMTEAIHILVKWAKTQVEVNSIFAQTAKNNPASFTLLEKTGFVKVGEDETIFNWRLFV
ncbi:MAG: N-acetyltransferase [Pedobacter sp.]|nr:MAG: N-acetyltransferase [Pedobacter sp.]